MNHQKNLPNSTARQLFGKKSVSGVSHSAEMAVGKTYLSYSSAGQLAIEIFINEFASPTMQSPAIIG
jgi:hypothetical protein